MHRPLVLAVFLATSPAAAHSIYDDWLIPGTNTDCCHDQDCGPTEFCTLPTGGEGVVLYGGCIAIPYGKVIPNVPPDGRPHICASAYPSSPPTIYCIALPVGT